MQTWKAAVGTLSTSSTSSCSLWLTSASVVGLPIVASRHNTPSRAHAITKMVLAEKKGGDNVAIIVRKLISRREREREREREEREKERDDKKKG